MSTSSNWWANKLGQPQTQQSYPPQQPAAPPPAPQQPYVQPPQIPAQEHVSSMQSSRCPGCGSGNYGKSALTPEARARCYDCGYPIMQSGSGISGGPSASGPAQPAKQVPTGGWNPTTIIGKVE